MTRARDLADSADKDIAGTLTLDAVNASGVITGLTVEATGTTAAGDNAAMGYTTAEGLILTGQGSTNDVTIKNDADADVIEIPTGTVNVTMAGTLGVVGEIAAASLDISGAIDVDGTTNLDVVDIDGAVDFAAATTHADDATFADGAEVRLGNDNDMALFSSSGSSFIRVNEGIFRLRANDMRIMNQANDESMIVAANGGAVTLYHNNVPCLSTATSGSVTIADNLSLTSDSARLNIGADNDLKLIHDGTNGTFESAGNLTVDVAGTIILDGDAAGATVHLKDAGTHWGSIFRSDSNFNIKSEASNKDIVFFGNDGGAEVTALTLDMSEGGRALFTGGDADGVAYFRKNGVQRLISYGTTGTASSATISGLASATSLCRTRKVIAASTATDLVAGYGGSIVKIAVAAASGVADAQYTILATHAWTSAAVLFSQNYGSNAVTFSFTSVNGTLKVSHNHSGNLVFNVSAMICTGPGAG